MQSNKFLQRARKIVKKDAAMFETLMEFEKTKKMENKTRLNFTIDKSIAMNFRKLCKKKGQSMSAQIEKAMKEFNEEKKIN